MIDLDKDIELYKSKVAFYESQNTRGEYAVTVRELKFVIEILEALRTERSQGDLISRSALKNYWENRILTDCSYISNEEILQSIDDASAVEPDSLKGKCSGSCYLCDVSDCGADTIKEGKNET